MFSLIEFFILLVVLNKTVLCIHGFHSIAAMASAMPIGGMIEIPAAALALGVFVKRLDFLSIGTNDLIQYTLAIDRADEAVAHLYDPLHPAVLRLIAQTIETGARVGVPVAVCGEMAGDPQLTRLLLGMGLRDFSMHPAQIFEVKQEVLRSHFAELRARVSRLLRYDAMNMQFRELRIRRDKACPVCGDHPTVTSLIDYEQFCGMRRGEAEAPAAVEISSADYEAMRERGDDHLLLDVREAFELGICQIEGNVNIPLGQLPARLGELAAWKDRLVVCQCKSGRRSMKALDTLQKHGFRKLVNLQGGILAWGEHTGDPAIAPY